MNPSLLILLSILSLAFWFVLDLFLESAAKDRGVLYNQLLNYFNEHGQILDFSIAKKKTEETKTQE